MKEHHVMRLDLQWKILIGIVSGMTIGILLNQTGCEEHYPKLFASIKQVAGIGGDIFLRLLRMVIVPLVFSSIFMAVIRLGTTRELEKIGQYTIIYYFTTTAIAVAIGLILVNCLHPGIGIDPSVLEKLDIRTGVPDILTKENVKEKGAIVIIVETLLNIIPENIMTAFTEGNLLQIIFFSLFCALIVGVIGERKGPLVATIAVVDNVMQKAVSIVMIIAPYCIFLLVCKLCMDLGFNTLGALAKYALTVLLGLVIHSTICLSLLVFFIGRMNPLHLFRSVLPALMTAWSTASSAVTLPVTMKCLKERASCDELISNFVVTFGATINMDGTALYESVAVIFIAELLGISLTLPMQVVVFFTATLAAVGAAAIPGAGLITMSIVLSAVGLPLEGIGLILVIDRLLDQFRTAVNVWGDVTAAAVVERLVRNTRKGMQ